MSELHTCPWPGCLRTSTAQFWDCAPHWYRLPLHLQREFLQTRVRAAEVQPVDHQMAIERIRNHLADLPPDMEVPQYAGQRAATAAPEIGDAFVAGWTAEGQLCLFWPREGEYLLLGANEIKVLRRAVTL